MYFEGLVSSQKGIIAISVTAAMSVSLGRPWAGAELAPNLGLNEPV